MHTGQVYTATTQGRATGNGLRRWGTNWDLAPVVDEPTTRDAFVWRQGRPFSFSAPIVARYASAFASGLQSRGLAAGAKHFSGLGSATPDADFAHVGLHPAAAQRAAALKPHETMIPAGVDSIMAAAAGFDAYDPSGAVAALSRPIVTGLLRGGSASPELSSPMPWVARPGMTSATPACSPALPALTFCCTPTRRPASWPRCDRRSRRAGSAAQTPMPLTAGSSP